MKIGNLLDEILGEDEEKAVKEVAAMETVDVQKETFYLCNRLHELAKYDEDANIIGGQSYLCFATEDGYFAALNDDDETEYFCIEVLKEKETIGFVLGETDTGVYGSFFEEHDVRWDEKIGILPFESIEEDDAMVWVLDDDDEDGAFARVVDVQVVPHTPHDIRVKVIGETEENILGCAVMQGLDAVAFLTDYDAQKQEYEGISAEAMAVDLCRKVYERRMLEMQHESEKPSSMQNDWE